MRLSPHTAQATRLWRCAVSSC